ncbi:helix-turn-helix domain-containing protein [Bacillus sp. DJP31]|uniref:helix-turn-helix domain-containing protein n=1 Tax=Bacillus sp. DJP31 TaxID=3409789 RepID=UPI003BB78BC5
MVNIRDYEQEKMWDSVQTLVSIDVDQAKAVLKAVIERSFQYMNLLSPIGFSIRLAIPSVNDIDQLRKIEKEMRSAQAHLNQEKAYETLVDFIEYISKIGEGDPQIIRKKLIVSLLMEGKKTFKVVKKSDRLNIPYYTPNEVARKLGLSDQTIRRMCENGRFEGAYKTDGGHWKIPQDGFITTQEQDQHAESILKQIDKKNKEAGDVDEFDL